MKIVVLDGYGMNPGDLDWSDLKALGDVTIYDRTSPEDVYERSKNADLLLTNKVVLNADMLEKLPKLKYIGVLATGYNIVDVAKARDLGVVVSNIPSYSTMSVAQQAIALLLTITNHVEHYAEINRGGYWSRNPDFCWWDTPLIELAGKQIGIIGYGNTGKATAAVASALGMKVAVFSSKSQEELGDMIKMDIDEIFSTSDVVSLHCPLTPETHHLVNTNRLKLMKKSAILINTARGPLVDEHALAEALNNGWIMAAGTDVLSTEPPAAENPLLNVRNCFITPHIAWATKEARTRLLDIAVANIEAFLRGEPQNVVN